MHALLLGEPVKELLDLPLAPTDDCVPTQLLTSSSASRSLRLRFASPTVFFSILRTQLAPGSVFGG